MTLHNKNNKSELKKLASYYRPYLKLLVAVLLSSIAGTGLFLLIPLLVQHITRDILQEGLRDGATSIIRTGIIMVGIIILRVIFVMYKDYRGHVLGAKIERDMRGELFEHLQKLSFGFYDKRKVGELMSRLSNDLLDLAELLHHGPENIFLYGIQCIGTVVILLFINVEMTLIILVLMLFMGIWSYIFYNKLEVAYRTNNEQIANVNSYAHENLSGIRVVQSFANEKYEIAKFAVENNRFYRCRRNIYKQEIYFYGVVQDFLTPLITVIIVVVGGLWIYNGRMDLPTLLVFILFAAYLTEPVPNLAFLVQQYQGGMAGYRRFREIMDIEPDIADSENAIALEHVKGAIEFRQVSFQYDEAQGEVLKEINLSVKPTETVAIVGPSGIGKTTLCALIPRFYDATKGSVLIDGIDVKQVTLESLRQHIGVVRQEVFLFAGSIMENIRYGKPEASDEEVYEAAKKANAHEFITGFKDGYQTEVGQRGIRLSGGQQQRISIARVFLKDPSILIFDEATSALDYESERLIMDSIDELSKDRTMLIIAHRLTTIENADRIIELGEEGREKEIKKMR